jgi:hypothetical protein
MLRVNLDSLEVEARIDLWATVAIDGVTEERQYLLSFTIVGSAHVGFTIMDESYSTSLPYLKPVAAFREFLMSEIRRLRQEIESSSMAKAENRSIEVSATLAGFSTYSMELAIFDETRALLGQTKRFIEKAMQDRKGGFNRELKIDPQLLKKALETLGEVPCTDKSVSVLEK